jgi:hypothetical protein
MKAIIWKEWKRSRILFIAFLGAAILIPALPAHFFPNEGETARVFIRLIWVLFSLSAGWLFGEQSRRGTLPFLLARPATKPYLFCVHYLSYLIMLGALIAGSLLVHYIHMAIRFPGFSLLEIIFEPGLIFGLALCFFLFSLSLFIANSFVTFGSTVVGIAFLVIMFLMLMVLFGVPGRGTASIPTALYSLRLIESPLLFLFTMICGGMIFATLSLLEISFDELRDAKNRRWISTISVTSVLSVALLIGTTGGVTGVVKKPTSLEIKQILTGLKVGDIPQAAVAITDDAVYTIRTPQNNPFLKSGDSRVKRIVRVEGQPYGLVRQKHGATLAYHSDKPIWGQEIRLLHPFGGGIRSISPSDYSQTSVLGEPFVSPDNDRIAYLRTSTPRFWGKATTSLWITKLGSVSDYAELPGDVETAQWEPIGWTPDGYKFMLRKREAGKTEIWAVDWVARGPSRLLEDFPDAIITADDLPKDGKWFSFVRKTADGKWNLGLIDYREGESKDLGTFDSEPLRAWVASGTRFAYWEHKKGYSLKELGDPGAIEYEHTCPDIPPVLQMRWSPHGDKLALVTSRTDTEKVGPRLLLLDPFTCTIEPLIEDFPATKQQWTFYHWNSIIYADGGELMRYNLESKSTFTLFSLASLHDEK